MTTNEKLIDHLELAICTLTTVKNNINFQDGKWAKNYKKTAIF
jgi:hypothetical protein